MTNGDAGGGPNDSPQSDLDPEDALERAEDGLDRAADLEKPEAIEVLRGALRDVRALEGDADEVHRDRLETLETRLEQRIAEVRERDAYDSGLGAAMNPEEDDAP
ncbi:hypothetical protein ACFQGT_19515 [Natrialbaceae archaeon GCM10025810]|uniref:hypothetical protein n=1 Tax=Halovalidus salilacus TaxID=3075124 RepID=UPI00360C9587